MIVGALALGVAIGLSLGALGGGGSILTVPALVFVLGLTAQEATTGSLVIVGVTAAAATLGHARAGHTRWARGAALALAGLPASVLGSALNRHVDPDVLLLAFAALMLVAAAGMLARSREPGTDRAPAAEPVPPSRARTVVSVVVAGLAIGFLTGFLGVGGGFVIVPVLVVLLRYPMPDAVGTSLLVIALNSGVALAARAGAASFAWGVIVPFTLAAVVGSAAGRRVADRLAPETLTRAFGALLVVVALYVGVRAVLGTA